MAHQARNVASLSTEMVGEPGHLNHHFKQNKKLLILLINFITNQLRFLINK